MKKLYKILNRIKSNVEEDLLIQKREIVDSFKEKEELWKIYDDSFLRTNKETPCRQSLDKKHFFDVLMSSSVAKYIAIFKPSKKIIGIGMISNDLKNSPWISEDYFKSQFAGYFSEKLIYYFMGIAISKEYRRRGYAIGIIEYIIDDIPQNAIMGFDHSQKKNPYIKYFTSMVKQSRFIKRKYLDSQRYYLVYKK